MIMDQYEFKKYLLSELPDSRQEELIFWKKRIPMPVDMVYKMYNERAALFSQYIDHLLAGYIIARSVSGNSTTWQEEFELQPTSKNKSREENLRAVYRERISDSGLRELARRTSELLMIPEHSFTEDRFIHAIMHEGRKYKRLYIHNEFRKIYQQVFPELLDLIATSNGDMFSNVVADILGVYRMGFADAFSVMFNKLIDYTVNKSLEGVKDYSRESGIRLTIPASLPGSPDAIHEPVTDGSFWEPVYKNSRKSVRVNSSHPFYSRIQNSGMSAQSLVDEFLLALATIENEALKESERRTLEIFRQETSRKLRLLIEDQQIV